MIRILIFILLAFSGPLAKAQVVTLDECRKAAQENYPLACQYDLIRLSEQYTLANVARGNLPQVSISGKISYQSDATELPFSLPGIDFHGLPKDQYQTMIEIRQNVWDGGQIRNRKQLAEASARESERQLDVSMYALNERVNQVFFGILLLDEQLGQNSFLAEELKRNLRDVEAYRTNGTANDADVDAVQVELLDTRRQRAALETSRTAYVRMLALLTGMELADGARLSRPEPGKSGDSQEINRPELALYDAQQQSVDVQQHGLRAGYMPQLSLFAQGAYGNPGLDMLKDKFTAYGVVGARLTWNFGSLYTLKNDKRQLDNQRRQIASNRELFLFNTRLQLAEQEGSIAALRRQMREDDEIIRLRVRIRQAAEAKVAAGTLTVNEMLREVTAESLARQDKALHEIQLLMDIYQQRHTRGTGENRPL